MQNKFFGSILNSILLLVLIILMIIAIRLMLQNKEIYFPVTNNGQQNDVIKKPVDKNTEPSFVKTGILGNKDDLISFSILPNSKVSGVVSYKGTVKGGYFFEGNILVGVKDLNKKTLLQSHGTSKTDWMTAGPVEFEGTIDFSKIAKGPAYLEIHNDNASGLPEYDKSILIPVTIE